MEGRKMQKTSLVLVCVLLSVFCFSSVSYSNNDHKLLIKYKDALIRNNSKMRYNNKDLMATIKITNYKGYDIYSRFTSLKDELLWSYDMITFFSMTYRLRYNQNKMIINRLIYIKEGLHINLTLINKICDYIKVVPLLHIINKQRGIIRASSETIDKTIRLMKKMSKNRRKNRSK